MLLLWSFSESLNNESYLTIWNVSDLDILRSFFNYLYPIGSYLRRLCLLW